MWGQTRHKVGANLIGGERGAILSESACCFENRGFFLFRSSHKGLLFLGLFYIKPVFDCMLNHFYKNKNWLYIFPVRNDDKII